jgi:hypothetical protein
LRDKVLELEVHLKAMSNHSPTQKQKLGVMQQTVTELESICHDHMALHQFIYEITERMVIVRMAHSWLTVDE